ncbi:MAG: hypothetical protein ACFFER_08985, partial [Candidatus Thorarchaeota archaeon]
GFPMLYDDREYWTKQRIQYDSWPLWKRIAIRPFTTIIPEWERQMLSKYLTITVSEGIAVEHRKICENVVVLRNLGLRSEFEGLDVNKNRSGTVYVGSDFERDKFSRHRDMTGLVKSLDFDVLSGLPRRMLYKKLTRYRIGLLPFRTTEYSKYINASKTFDYLNCGLQVLMTRNLYEAHGNLPYTHPFDNYEELKSLVSSINTVDPEEIMQYASENLVWETQSESLLGAYQKVLSE